MIWQIVLVAVANCPLAFASDRRQRWLKIGFVVYVLVAWSGLVGR